jgi:hypothetical protein
MNEYLKRSLRETSVVKKRASWRITFSVSHGGVSPVHMARSKFRVQIVLQRRVC